MPNLRLSFADMLIHQIKFQTVRIGLLLVMLIFTACTNQLATLEVSLESQAEKATDSKDLVIVEKQTYPPMAGTATDFWMNETETPQRSENTEPPIPEQNLTASSTEVGASNICSPLEEHTIAELAQIISAPYDPPPPGKEQRHHGVDFSYYRRGERTTILGVGVQSVLDGVVVARGDETFPYGNFLIIETVHGRVPVWLQAKTGLMEGQSLYLLYAHMQDSPQADLGEHILSCQVIGSVGTSGNAVEPHLHLEARVGPSGASFPAGLAYYHTQTTEEQRDNYTTWRTGGDYLHFDPMTILIQPADTE